MCAHFVLSPNSRSEMKFTRAKLCTVHWAKWVNEELKLNRKKRGEKLYKIAKRQTKRGRMACSFECVACANIVTIKCTVYNMMMNLIGENARLHNTNGTIKIWKFLKTITHDLMQNRGRIRAIKRMISFAN